MRTNFSKVIPKPWECPTKFWSLMEMLLCFKLKKEDLVKDNKYSLLIGWIDILYTQSMEYFTTVTTTLPIYIQTMLSIVE